MYRERCARGKEKEGRRRDFTVYGECMRWCLVLECLATNVRFFTRQVLPLASPSSARLGAAAAAAAPA